MEETDVTDLAIVRVALNDDYEVLEELGRGGMATVYRARDRQLDRDVALKVLPFGLAFDRDLVARFEREARTAAQLEHPHIVPIHRVGRSGQVIYFAMQFLRGESLSARLRSRGTLTAAQLRRVLAETAGALGHAHGRGVVHRDVKPDNIMLDAQDRCMVTDFGIARSASDSRLTATGMSMGTPRYMSPEQARAKDVDGRSDLYSLGVVGYECLVGHVPFDGSDAFAILLDHIQTPVPRPALAASGTAEERDTYAIVERLLAKDPGDRFQSAGELIEALAGAGRDWRGGRPRAAAPVQPSGDVTAATAGASYAPVAGAPRSSAALDAALEAGVELLRQQKPKIEAGVAAGLRFVEANAPRAREAARRAGADAARGAAPIVARGASAVREAGPVVARANDYLRRNGRRVARVSVATIASVTLAYYAVHFATKHRSHCPPAAAAERGAGDSAGGAAPRARPFSLMLDPIRASGRGADLDVYYDVCGLAGGGVKTRISVVKEESGFARLLGARVGPVVETFDESAKPAMRRHRTIDFAHMPAGSYTLAVIVTDEKGRRRERSSGFQVVER